MRSGVQGFGPRGGCEPLVQLVFHRRAGHLRSWYVLQGVFSRSVGPG